MSAPRILSICLPAAGWALLAIVLPGAQDSVPTQEHASVSRQLLSVRRICVERLSGGQTADQIRDMIISELQRTGLFVITENPEGADAILRGSAEDLVYTETHESREDVDARGSISIYRSNPATGARYADRRGYSASTAVGEGESHRTVERRHEAVAAVRLVNNRGEVIWATVKESRGAKLRSASSHVAEQVAQQLVRDYQRLLRGEPVGGAVEIPRAANTPYTSTGPEP